MFEGLGSFLDSTSLPPSSSGLTRGSILPHELVIIDKLPTLSIQSMPMRIGLFDKLNFPSAKPLLNRLFALNSCGHILKPFKPYEARHVIFRGEASVSFVFVLLYSAR